MSPPGDGPQEFHLVLLDNGRTDVLADELGRQALRCIRCSACLNVCPVYERTGGHAYGSIYPGPIGAILRRSSTGVEHAPLAAVRIDAVRRLLRRLPGQDRHPRSSSTCAQRRRAASGARPARSAMRALAAGRSPTPAALRAGAAAGPRGPPAGWARPAARAAGGWTASRDAARVPERDLPRVVGRERGA